MFDPPSTASSARARSPACEYAPRELRGVAPERRMGDARAAGFATAHETRKPRRVSERERKERARERKVAIGLNPNPRSGRVGLGASRAPESDENGE